MEMTGVDYAVIGEGELADIELIDCIQNGGDVRKLHGVIYRDEEGDYNQTSDAVPIEDIDSLPFPNYEGFEVEEYFNNQKIMAS